ncbi:MAG: class I SAM-dependent methyltransferase [Pseudomonadota bacterium]
MDFFEDIYTDIPKFSPGTIEATRKAYQMLAELPARPRILDVACGTGMQTIELAKISKGKIVALDIYQPYLEILNKRAATEGVRSRIKTRNMSMFSLDFDECSFDVIWAEASIHIIGFEKGLKQWKKLLKQEGYIVVSELAWMKESPPEEAKKFWGFEYPSMKSHKGNIEIIKKCGYVFISSFILSETDWWKNCYDPLEKKIGALREIHRGNNKNIRELNHLQREIDLFRKYSDYYGYAFYIMKNS